MRVTLSVATTADRFMDDDRPERLVISTPGDWEAVHALRAAYDAILVGAETLRRDNPALLVRDEALRAGRVAQGRKPDITKVTLTVSGDLSPALRFFTESDADRIVFSNTKIADIQNFAEVISSDTPITARLIVTELEKRGVERLLVEGGARILRMFLDEGMADTLRLACNPRLSVGERGRARFDFEAPAGTAHTDEQIDGMRVVTYTFHPDTSAEDLRYLGQAVALGLRCTPGATSYCVGAVVVTLDGQVFEGYTHETSPIDHAEQAAVSKALRAGAVLRGAAMYSSMEPCSQRASAPESCSQLLIRHEFARAVFALYEPAHFVVCRGALSLREAGLDVRVYPRLAAGVLTANAHILRGNK